MKMKKLRLTLAALLCSVSAAAWGATAGAAGTVTYERLEGAQILWETPQTENGQTIYYRIPAFATANDGRLIAVTDKRYGHAGDLGGHRIDILVKTSTDDGKSWSTDQNLTENITGASSVATGFGDAAMVADRDTDKVLILTASGTAGFFSSSRENKLGVHQFISEDGGQSFNEPVSITEMIYGFDNTWPGLFVGSGRIMQSRYIKVGSHYRIYCAISTRSTSDNNQHENWVIYSDDFGDSWNVLGGTTTAPIAPADEPKVEELPNGDVIIASRKDNGRYINVFTYADGDETYTQGSWGQQATLPLGSTRGTDGETYVVYAKKADTDEYVYLALQSIPTTGNRCGVGIFYKELSESDTTPQEFVKGWSDDNFLMVQPLESAYSTFTVQKDGKLGFFYEEGNPAYDMVYVPISIEQITDGKYETAFTGIGSKATPYQLDTKEQVAGYVDTFSGEKVYWDLDEDEQAVTYLKEIFNERKAKALELFESEQIDKTREEALAVKAKYDEAMALPEDADNDAIVASARDMQVVIDVYEDLIAQQETVRTRNQEAKELYDSNGLVEQRLEAVALIATVNEIQEILDANALSTKTYEEITALVTQLEEKMAAYTAGMEIEDFSVESRYNTVNIRFAGMSGVSQYKVQKSDAQDGTYTDVTTVDAVPDKISYSHIDNAGVDKQSWYKIVPVAAEAAEGETITLPTYEPLQDKYPTGIQAVQKHAEEDQLHYDFVAGENGEYTYFNGSRMYEGTKEELDKVKDLSEGSVIISYKPDNATGRKSFLILKQENAVMPTGVGGNLGGSTGFAFFQDDAKFRWDSSVDGLRGGWNDTAPANTWGTFGFSNGIHGVAVKNVVNSWNGGEQLGWHDKRWDGFMTRPSKLAVLTVGADKTADGMALAYNGHIAYITITDEVMTQAEMNEYTSAVTAQLTAKEAEDLPAPGDFEVTVEGREVNLSWTAVAGIVDKYQVSSDNGTNWVDADSSTDHVFADLAGGRDYTFKVRAVNGGGEGAEAEATATLSEFIVATPTFSVAEGTYTETQTVEISTTTAEATIYYTTDGTEPTEASTEYTEALTVSATTTIKAIAVKEGMDDSAVASVTYTINTEEEPEEKQTVETPVFSVPAGTYKEAQKVAITSATQGATIYYTTNGTAPTTDSTEYTQEITVSESMTIKAIAVKEGMENSAVAEAAYVIEKAPAEKETVKTPTFSVAAGTYDKAQRVTLTSETEGATIYYTTDGKEPTTSSTKYSQAIMVDKSMTIKAIAVKEGMNNSTVAQAAYVIQLPDSVKETVKTPAFSVKAGTYNKAQSVTLTSATAGATIYYTTDGKAPTTSSTKYSKAITVDKTMTIKAIAVKAGMNNSAVATAAYTIKVEVKDKEWIFTDVEQNGGWKHQSVKYVYNKDIMGAVGASTEFQPDRPLSRSMFATVLYRMADSPKVAYKAQFSDVPAGKWYSDAIIWAYQNKIVSGLGDGSFGIDQNITREQIAKMLYEYANVCKYDVSAKKDLNSFTDVKEVSGWAVKYMQWATAVEMITGKPNDEAKTSFRMDPKGEATRAECAAMLMRFANKYHE